MLKLWMIVTMTLPRTHGDGSNATTGRCNMIPEIRLMMSERMMHLHLQTKYANGIVNANTLLWMLRSSVQSQLTILSCLKHHNYQKYPRCACESVYVNELDVSGKAVQQADLITRLPASRMERFLGLQKSEHSCKTSVGVHSWTTGIFQRTRRKDKTDQRQL